MNLHAARLVNPYTGVILAMDLDGVRGLSRNGRLWEIQVQVETPGRAWGSLNRSQGAMRYYRCAVWNKGQGLRMLPIDPALDQHVLSVNCAAAADRLDELVPQKLPFELGDVFEQWLLDRQHRPLALLASVRREAMIPQLHEYHWHAVANALEITGYTQRQGMPLEDLIRSHAGQSQWFKRDCSGDGTGLDYRCPAGLKGRVMSSDDFPELLLREDWEDPEARRLVAEWTTHLAPWLLMLPGISDDRRGRLEQAAATNPLMVDEYCRVYPRMVDRQLMDKIRIESKIMQSNE